MYARVFTSLFDGSMRGHSDLILVFVNCLCHANQDGIVDRTAQAIADETGLSLARVSSALLTLEAPDVESRSRNDDGRRLKRIDPERSWGWEIVNFKHYDSIRNAAERREYMRKFMADKRKQKVLADVSTVLAPVSNVSLLSLSTDVSTATGREEGAPTAPHTPKPRFEKPTPEQVAEYGKQIGFQIDGQAFCDHYEARGWKYNGGLAMKNWQAAVRTWKRRDRMLAVAPGRKPYPSEILKLLAELREQKERIWNSQSFNGVIENQKVREEYAALKLKIRELEKQARVTPT